MKRTLATVLAVAAGIAAAIALTLPATAFAWSWNSLPNGYSVSVVNYGAGCHQIYIDTHYMGDDCTDPAGLQSNVDAYVNATICARNPAAGQAQGLCLPTTSTVDATTTDTSSTTTDATTTAGVTDTAPTTTVAAAAVTTAAVQPAPTVTVTVTATDQSLVDRVTALEQQYAALAARVTAIQDANAAAWQTFADDLAAGVDPATAALDARSAGLNAIYQLG